MKMHDAVTDERRKANQLEQLTIFFNSGFVKSLELRHCDICKEQIAEVFLSYGEDNKMLCFCREHALWAKEEIMEGLAECEIADEDAEKKVQR